MFLVRYLATWAWIRELRDRCLLLSRLRISDHLIYQSKIEAGKTRGCCRPTANKVECFNAIASHVDHASTRKRSMQVYIYATVTDDFPLFR